MNEKARIIYQEDPTNPYERNAMALKVAAVVAFLLILIGNIGSGLISVLFILLITIASEWIENHFDGWEINENYILIKRINLRSQKTEVMIPYNDISEIIFVERTKTLSHLKLRTSRGIYALDLRKGIFYFASTLLFLKNKGISVSLNSPDYELQLFLEGKIDSFPIYFNS